MWGNLQSVSRAMRAKIYIILEEQLEGEYANIGT